MERTPSHPHASIPERSRAPSLSAEHTRGPLAETAQTEYLSALAEGRPIDAETARSIAFAVAANAPDDSQTSALHRFALTGRGRHAQLLGEYAPLSRLPETPAREALLIDVLGTHLLNQDLPTRSPEGSLPYPLEADVFYAADAQNRQVAVPFQYPAGLDRRHIVQLTRRLTRYIQKDTGAFRAFLRLPGIDAADTGLVNYFHGVHLTGADVDLVLSQPVEDGRTPIAFEVVQIGGTAHVFSR
ncbi:MAG: hypothetical protein J0I18_07180 [Actinobacteria bacterium]|nr:hypothetical protein [Actinomycetota bacterium]